MNTVDFILIGGLALYIVITIVYIVHKAWSSLIVNMILIIAFGLATYYIIFLLGDINV